jgi:NAD(P)-dependent dehydrogenase (short-subunit alcohol dehydrogenase family)
LAAGAAWNLPSVKEASRMEIQGRRFLVTGGGSGLGAATGAMLAQGGAQVALMDRDQARVTERAEELGGAARAEVADVTREDEVAAAIARVEDAFGGLDGVVCCAGIAIAQRTVGRGGPHPLDLFRRVIEVNLIGTFNVIRLAAPVISRNQAGADGERGVVVMTASVAAFDGQIGQVAYAASKGGVAALTLPLAREFARDGIRVVSIAPGIFDTPMMQGLPEAARVSLGQQVPFPSRLGQPSEYADLARHIIENRMLNGEVIRLDGAIRMAPR